MTPSYKTGERAPSFEARLLNGDPFALTDLRGSYVLVYFWGSWCGPCRLENPKLRQLWLEYKDRTFTEANGFEIVSIAIEVDKDRPSRVIRRDGLSWKYHIVDLGESLRFFDSPISNLWGINQVPTHFLLNQKGEIIGYNLSAEELNDRLSSRARGAHP
jgi:thiol-disulfide isomerase/thioredoxin